MRLTREEILGGTAEQLQLWIAEAMGFELRLVECERFISPWLKQFDKAMPMPTIVYEFETYYLHPEYNKETYEDSRPYDGRETAKDMMAAVPYWPQDIAAAWGLINHMITGTAYECYLQHQTDGWYCSFQHPGTKGGQAIGRTAPIAICRAFLLARLDDVE